MPGLNEGQFLTDHLPHQTLPKGTDFQRQAKRAVVLYFNRNMEKHGNLARHLLTEEDVFIVWFVKALQNWKVLVSTMIPDGMYYELTYNGDKQELYIDVYQKMNNVVMFNEDLL